MSLTQAVTAGALKSIPQYVPTVVTLKPGSGSVNDDPATPRVPAASGTIVL
jgi:hypothetical protein